MVLPTGLLEAVRSYLDITWDDPAGDEKLTGIIARGMKYLNWTAGGELDYSEEDKPRELLMDYCRYVRSNALDEFQINYLHELLFLQIAQEIKAHKELVKLSSLTIGTLALSPAFDPAVKVYTANTSNIEDNITVITAHPLAVVIIMNGSMTVANNTATKWVDGENRVYIIVTNEGTFSVYNVVVTKE